MIIKVIPTDLTSKNIGLCGETYGIPVTERGAPLPDHVIKRYAKSLEVLREFTSHEYIISDNQIQRILMLLRS